MFNHERSAAAAVHKYAALCLLAALTLGGCSRRNEATVGTPQNPLVVLLSPAHAPAPESNALDLIKKHLETATGMSVEVKMAESPAAAVNAFSSGLTDAGLLTLEEYLVAREEYGVRPELQVLRGARLDEYSGAILTRSKGGAAGVRELEGKKVGFVGPYSMSGFTLPAVYLKKEKVTVKPEFYPSHEEVLKKLLAGEIMAAATYARQAARAPGLKVLAATGVVPNEPLVVRGRLSKEKRGAIKAAFLTLPETAEGRRALAAMADITGFRPIDSQHYRRMHDFIREQNMSVYDLVPGGWDIYRLNQPYTPDR